MSITLNQAFWMVANSPWKLDLGYYLFENVPTVVLTLERGGGVRGIPVQRSCLFLIFRSLFSLQIISRSLFWEHSPFTVLSNNYSLFTVLRWLLPNTLVESSRVESSRVFETKSRRVEFPRLNLVEFPRLNFVESSFRD